MTDLTSKICTPLAYRETQDKYLNCSWSCSLQNATPDGTAHRSLPAALHPLVLSCKKRLMWRQYPRTKTAFI